MKKNYSLILRKIIFAFNSISVIGIAIFILYTTRKICDAYVASDFLEKVNAIPANPSALVGEILVLVAIMGISFICREKFVRENTGVYYLTLLIDFCASFFIVYRLDFNYNGILLWVFANLIAHIKDMGGKYVLAVISLLSYIGTNHGIISVSTKIFSVNDYIKVYDIGIQKVLYWLYNLLTSLNIILFQLIAFLILLGLFSIVFQILLKISGLIEKALNFTIILGIPSKLLGMVVGLIEGYVILFIILFVINMTSFNNSLISESSLKPKILTSSPVLSNVVKDATNTATEIYDFVDVYVKDKDSDKFNYNAIDTMLKNKVITPEYVEKLVKKRKIDVKNIDFLIEKYKNKGDE